MDDVEGELRDHNPLSVRRASPLDEHAFAEMRRIVATDGLPTSSRRNVWRLPTTIISSVAVAAAIVGLLVVVNLTSAPAPSVAAPPVMSPSPIGSNLRDLLGRLAMKARDQAWQSEPSHIVRYETWSASVEVEPERTSYFVQPQEVERIINADGSGSVSVRAGDVKYGAVSKDHPSAEVGVQLERYDYGSGEYPRIYPEAPPEDATQLDDYFAVTMGSDQLLAGDFFKAVQDVRYEWNLNAAQTAAILDHISGLADVEVLGEVTDRMGRKGIAVQTETRGNGAFRDILVFDPDSGRLLAGEEMYLGGLRDISLDYPTVINYIAWKEPTQ